MSPSSTAMSLTGMPSSSAIIWAYVVSCPCPLGACAESGDGLSGWMDANVGTVEHLDAQNIEVAGRACPDNLGEAGNADTHQLSLLALLGLLSAQVFVADNFHRLFEGALVVTAVVLPAQR